MTNQHEKNRRGKRRERHPLLSVSTILIFSGFLIGLTSSQVITGGLQGYVMATGIIGILSFLALDHVKSHRREQAEVHEQLYVEGRLEKHVDHFNFNTSSLEDLSDIDEVEMSLEELQTAS